MIRITEQNEIVKMDIKMTIPQMEVFNFLHLRGYEVKAWLWKYKDESFPGGKTCHEKWTFTATRKCEEQSEDNLYLTVFEAEIKKALKEFMRF